MLKMYLLYEDLFLKNDHILVILEQIDLNELNNFYLICLFLVFMTDIIYKQNNFLFFL
jgi:hypothetical protein